MSTDAEPIYWERELTPAGNWKAKYPNIWQLHSEFNLKVIQRLRSATPIGAADYLLASKTSCSNGFRTISSLCFLSSPFQSLTELDQYLAEHIVDLLHAHFFGQISQDFQCGHLAKM